MLNMRSGARAWGWCLPTIALVLSSTPFLQAEPVGSPSSILRKGKWAMGLGTSVVPTRAFEGDGEAFMYQIGHFRGYGLTDWLSVYGKIGGAYVEVDDPTIKKTNDSSTKNSFGTNVLSSVQVKAKLFEHKRLRWEWDGSLQYVDIRARHKEKNEGRWHEWQFATSVAKAIGPLKPYVGVKYATVDFTFRVREEGRLLRQGTYEEEGPVGFFFGSDWYLGQYEDIVINVEASSLNGTEVGIAISYTF